MEEDNSLQDKNMLHPSVDTPADLKSREFFEKE